jgi:hypothetical protein
MFEKPENYNEEATLRYNFQSSEKVQTATNIMYLPHSPLYI